MCESVDNRTTLLSPEWKRKLKELSLRYPAESGIPRIAVFDLDNTLLINDVGDAVLADLRARSLQRNLRERHTPLALSWPEYAHMIECGRKKEAYRSAVRAMSGLETQTIREATRNVMRPDVDIVEVDGFRVPTPRPDPRMAVLLKYLKRMDFRIFIISASNQISVRTVASEFLGLNPENTWGIQSSIRPGPSGRPTLTSHILDPFPYGPGKVDLYRLHLGHRAPMISAGDSESDIPMLNLTPRNGWIIWRGEAELLNRDPSPFLTPEIVTAVPMESRLDITPQE